MAKLEILKFPDPRLREVSLDVTVFDEKLKKLTEDMLETMYDASGIGLAAPQVNVLQRVLVIDTRTREEKTRRYNYDDMTELEQKVKQPLVLINPKIKSGSGKQLFDEGCLSVPSYYETVERFLEVVVEAQDIHGKTFEFKTDGLLAVCVQHEMDHLEGKLFIDRISFMKSQKIKTQIKKSGYPVKKKEDLPPLDLDILPLATASTKATSAKTKEPAK